MLLAFVDETGDQKFPDYFGLCLAVVNASFYPALKRNAQKHLVSAGWDPSVEFKGSHIFTANKGCTAVGIDARVALAGQLLALNASTSNSRIRFYYSSVNTKDVRTAYLSVLPRLLHKALPIASARGGKDLLCLACDFRDDVSAREIRAAVTPTVSERSYSLLEEVQTPHSNFETVGILFADIVAYLSSRIDTISNDAEFFENLPPEAADTHGRVRRLRSSQKLIGGVKQLSRVTVSVSGV